MSGECVNYVFGRTATPFNTALSAGGSSGGEGALVSMGGSPIGIGTDIGTFKVAFFGHLIAGGHC
jgi:amidase